MRSRFYMRSSRRRAFTLIEMSVVIVILGTVSALAVASMIVAMREFDHSRESLPWLMTRSRLEEQFRQDIHAAQSVSQGGESTTLQLQAVGVDRESVLYRTEGHSLHREASVDGKIVSRQQFRLGKLVSVTFQIHSEEVVIAQLTLTHQASKAVDSPPVRTESIAAVLLRGVTP